MRRAAEERKRREQEERAEEERARTKEESSRRQAEEEERRRGQEEAEQRRRTEQEAEEKRLVEEDDRRREVKEERQRKQKAEEEDERRREQEEDRKRQAEDDDRRRRQAEDEERVRQADAQAAAEWLGRQRKEDEDNKRRQEVAAELEKLRLQTEEAVQRGARQSLAVPPASICELLPTGLQPTDGTPPQQSRRASLMRAPDPHLSRSPLPSQRPSLVLPPSTLSPQPTEPPPPAEAEQLPPPGTPPQLPSTASVGWVTDEDRDAVFEFLANEVDVFVADLQLTDTELDALLSTGGSKDETIRLCRLVSAQHKQVQTVAELQAAMQEQRNPTAATRSATHALAASWITAADRDALFDYLAHDSCGLFCADVQLNNRALDAIMGPASSVEVALLVLARMDEAQLSFESSEALAGAMKAAALALSDTSTAAAAASAPVESDQPVAASAAIDTASGINVAEADKAEPQASDSQQGTTDVAEEKQRAATPSSEPSQSAEHAHPPDSDSSQPPTSQESTGRSSRSSISIAKASSQPPADDTTSPASSAATAAAGVAHSAQTAQPAAASSAAAAALPTTVSHPVSSPPAPADVEQSAEPTQLVAPSPTEQPAASLQPAAVPQSASSSPALAEVERPAELAQPVAPSAATEQPAVVPQPAPVSQPTAQLAEPTTSLINPAIAAIKAQQPQPRTRSSRPSSFSFQPTDPPLPPLPPTNPLSPLPPTHTWMTDSDREQLFAYLSLPSTRIFSQAVQVTPAVLDGMLVATGSVYTCIEVLNGLQKRQLTFPHYQPLLFALQREMALITNQPAQQPTITSTAIPQAANQPQSQPQPRPQSPHTENRASRDALFAYLSSPSCHLFSQSVKLNNFTLDRILYAGRGLACSLACCHFVDELGRQFVSVEALVEALRIIAGQREEQEAALLAVLSHPQHQRNLFGNPITVSADDVKRLWLSVQAGSDTMAYLLLVEDDQLSGGKTRTQLSSLTELRHEIQRRHATMRLERRKEMERLYEFMHLPARRCLQPGTIVAMEQCALLAMAGREDSSRQAHSTMTGQV